MSQEPNYPLSNLWLWHSRAFKVENSAYFEALILLKYILDLMLCLLITEDKSQGRCPNFILILHFQLLMDWISLFFSNLWVFPRGSQKLSRFLQLSFRPNLLKCLEHCTHQYSPFLLCPNKNLSHYTMQGLFTLYPLSVLASQVPVPFFKSDCSDYFSHQNQELMCLQRRLWDENLHLGRFLGCLLLSTDTNDYT